MRIMLLATAAGFGLIGPAVTAQEASPNAICLPPEEPFVPSADDNFRSYADMISADFERYFSELSAYFTCMDGTRQAVFDRAHAVSKSHQAFWQRAQQLGVLEKAAADAPDGQRQE